LGRPCDSLLEAKNVVRAVNKICGIDAPSLTCSRKFRKLPPYLLAICLGALSQAVAAATYWQLQQSGMTVFAEGDKNSAKHAAEMALRMQSAARWLLSWPDGYREPTALVFVLNESLLRHTFQYPPVPIGAYSNPTTSHELWVRSPSLVVVAAPIINRTGYELHSLQHAYGEALLRGETSHDWPVCVHGGMAALFAAAELSAPNHFYLSGRTIFGQYDDIRGKYDVVNPQTFLKGTHSPHEQMAQWELDQEGYSCYLLGFMIASATPEQRITMGKMLTAVGRGVPLGAAIASELQETQAEFTARYREFCREMLLKPEFVQIRVDFPEVISAMPEPTPISIEDLQALMGRLCSKLQNCRK
jgi:hypothetical protein